MVRDIRHVEQAMGSYEKKVQESELPIFKKLAKSIVSIISIPEGKIIARDMLTTKGPGTGLSPMKINKILGKTTLRNIPADTVINEEDIKWV